MRLSLGPRLCIRQELLTLLFNKIKLHFYQNLLYTLTSYNVQTQVHCYFNGSFVA